MLPGWRLGVPTFLRLLVAAKAAKHVVDLCKRLAGRVDRECYKYADNLDADARQAQVEKCNER